MFKVFPAAAKDHPLCKWKTESSDDPERIKLWVNLHGSRLKYWCVPCGPINDILVLDVDVKGNGYETLKGLEIPPTLTQKTPSGGLHYIFKYPKGGATYGNRVKFRPGLDSRGVGGYIVWYGETNGLPIAEAPQWFLDEILRNAPQESVQPGAGVKLAPDIAEGVVLSALENIRTAPEGESNNVLNVEAFKLGQLVASGSITRDYAADALLRAALDRKKPRYEAIATINSGLDGGGKKPIQDPFGAPPAVSIPLIPPPPAVTRWTPQAFEHADLLNTTKLKKPQLFENWSTEDIHITTADGGTGKTTMKLFEAVCLALGERFLGFRCISPGKTLYIAGEDTDKKVAAMLGQILRQLGLLDDPQYAEQVQLVRESIFVKKDIDLCLVRRDKHTGFLHPDQTAMVKLIEAIDDIKPRMIVFDPISSFWGSESALNDMAKAVTKFMSQLVEYSGACVEMINHMGKVSSGQKDMSQFAGRGGTGLPSHARVSRALRPVFDDEFVEMTGGMVLGDKQSAMLCNVNKFTDGSPLYNKPFLIIRDGYLFSRKNLSNAKLKEVENEMSDQERIFQFIKEVRQSDKWPSKDLIVAHFRANGNPLPQTRIKHALSLLEYSGHMGEKIKLVENPDQSTGGKVYVITDEDGKEL